MVESATQAGAWSLLARTRFGKITGACNVIAALLVCGAAGLLTGCQTTASVEERAQIAARESNWVGQTYSAGQFTLMGYRPRSIQPGGALAIYIEGDGVAWKTKTVKSTDPTPDDTITLRLAQQDPSPNRLYLGRPCQYLAPEALLTCDSKFWTSHRYAPEIVESLNAAVDQAKTATGAKDIALFGYSGGGGLAVLIAAQRSDVARIVTVAGNLDHAAWTRFHGDNPLVGSLNAADAAAAVSGIPQVHFVGESDTVVPLEISTSYLERSGNRSNISVVTVTGADHKCCWVNAWSTLLRDHVYHAP